MSKFGDWLRDELDTRRISQTELSVIIGVTPAQVSRIISGERSTTADTLKEIARAFHMPLQQIYRAAGILPPAPDINETIEQVLHEISELPEADQQEILAFIRMKNNLRQQRKKK